MVVTDLVYCKFLLDFGCKAYPEGIRDDFAQGYNKHTKVEDDQEGDYVFTPLENGE